MAQNDQQGGKQPDRNPGQQEQQDENRRQPGADQDDGQNGNQPRREDEQREQR